MNFAIGRVLACLAALAAGSASAAAQNLRIATEGTYPPWSFVDPNGRLTGWDVEIANALCEAMRRRCEILAQDWDGIIPGLNARKYDMIVASMGVTEARRRQVAFSNKYKDTASQFVAAKGTFPDTSPAALAGKRIGVQRGSIQDAFLTQNYARSDIVRYDKTTDVELDLISGRIDLLLANKLTSQIGFLQRPEASGLALVGQEYTGRPLGDGNAIAVRKDDVQLLEQVNAALDKIIADGTYDTITKRYFSVPLMDTSRPVPASR